MIHGAPGMRMLSLASRVVSIAVFASAEPDLLRRRLSCALLVPVATASASGLRVAEAFTRIAERRVQLRISASGAVDSRMQPAAPTVVVATRSRNQTAGDWTSARAPEGSWRPALALPNTSRPSLADPLRARLRVLSARCRHAAAPYTDASSTPLASPRSNAATRSARRASQASGATSTRADVAGYRRTRSCPRSIVDLDREPPAEIQTKLLARIARRDQAGLGPPRRGHRRRANPRPRDAPRRTRVGARRSPACGRER